MRVLAMSVVIIVALWGSSVRAQPSIVQEVHAVWAGCDYALRVEQDLQPIPSPRPFYRISVRSTAVPGGSCVLAARSIELATSPLEPRIAIAVDARGLVVAYTEKHSVRGVGTYAVTCLQRLDPHSLASLRWEWVSAGWTSTPGAAAVPGFAEVSRLVLYPSHVELTGTRGGNLVSVTPSGDSRFEDGTGFVVLYPDFFGAERKPPYLFVY
jgi:hypothetical protein